MPIKCGEDSVLTPLSNNLVGEVKAIMTSRATRRRPIRRDFNTFFLWGAASLGASA